MDSETIGERYTDLRLGQLIEDVLGCASDHNDTLRRFCIFQLNDPVEIRKRLEEALDWQIYGNDGIHPEKRW